MDNKRLYSLGEITTFVGPLSLKKKRAGESSGEGHVM